MTFAGRPLHAGGPSLGEEYMHEKQTQRRIAGFPFHLWFSRSRVLPTMARLAALLVVGFTSFLAGCDSLNDGGISVAFVSVSANGGPAQTTTQLTLTFDRAISGLGANDITLGGEAAAGVTLGTIAGTSPVHTLQLNNVTQGGNLTVTVSRPGYSIRNATRTVAIFRYAGDRLRTGRVHFYNTSSYRVSVRLNSFSGLKVTELDSGQGRTVDVRVSDHALGTTFAIVFMQPITDGADPSIGQIFAHAEDMGIQPNRVIEENSLVTVQIPQPPNPEFRSSFIGIRNFHSLPFELRHFMGSLQQDGNGLIPVPPGGTGIYRLDAILPGGVRRFEGLNVRVSVAETPVPAFYAENGYLYIFEFNGSSVNFIEAQPLIVR